MTCVSGTGFLEVPEQVDAIGIGQHQVHQHDFRPPRAQYLASLRGVGGGSGQIPSGLDQQLQEISGIPVVVDDQYAGRHVFTLLALICIV